MKRAQIEHGRWLQSMTEAANPKHGPRPLVESRVLYSTKNHSGETRLGDGMVTSFASRTRNARQRSGDAGDRTHDFFCQTDKIRCSLWKPGWPGPQDVGLKWRSAR